MDILSNTNTNNSIEGKKIRSRQISYFSKTLDHIGDVTDGIHFE